MKGKTPLKIAGINLILIALLFGLITANKAIVRPMITPNSILGIISGCFPNFIAAYLISLAPLTPVIIRNPKHGRSFVYVVASIVFFILAIEEVAPMWGASTHYDIYDIIASAIGSLLAVLTFEFIQKYKQHT